MRLIMGLILTISSISSLTACSSMSGNVVPEKGPTMENVYDSMASEKTPPNVVAREVIPLTVTHNSFYKLRNPELNMYVYSHLADKDEIPIPGYFTFFNAYEKDHFMLPNEIVGA
jgi:hypothetical protein